MTENVTAVAGRAPAAAVGTTRTLLAGGVVAGPLGQEGLRPADEVEGQGLAGVGGVGPAHDAVAAQHAKHFCHAMPPPGSTTGNPS